MIAGLLLIPHNLSYHTAIRVSNCFSTSLQAEALIEQSIFLQQGSGAICCQRELRRSATPSASKRGGGEGFEAIYVERKRKKCVQAAVPCKVGDL
jgi:hypothetical protein